MNKLESDYFNRKRQVTLQSFINDNWPLLLGLAVTLLIVIAIVAMVRSRRQLQELIENTQQQQREHEQALNHLLIDTREDLIQQVARGQRDEQKALLLTSSRLSQSLEKRFGEMQVNINRDNNSLETRLSERLEQIREKTQAELSASRLQQTENLNQFRESLEKGLNQHRQQLDERQSIVQKQQQDSMTSGMQVINKQVNDALLQHGESLGKRIMQLMEATDQRLKEISGQVDQRLSKGFEKTTETFTQVLTHLTRIDEAQKKLTELSANVVSLQELLSDKRSRGAYGEIQLAALVRNLLPEENFELQHTMASGRRVDCLLKLPEPTGNVAVDAKFPLESFQQMTDQMLSRHERDQAQRQFRQDIRKHINDIATKYIVPGETSDGAMMFIPAEAVFAEIHAHHPELVEIAQQRRIWMVSPTTIMAILTTARAVLRDAATQKQVHLIREHLQALSKDFQRFQQRMDNLSKHIEMAHKDVSEVHTSAQKISSRFEKIEQVQIEDKPN